MPRGFICDGATWAPNIGQAWLVHDWLFASGCFADGSQVSWRQANRIMVDIMRAEGWATWVIRVFRKGIKGKWSYRAWKEHRQK